MSSTTTTTATEMIHECDHCGYNAGPNNGWFFSNFCGDCREDADRATNGWTPQNSRD